MKKNLIILLYVTISLATNLLAQIDVTLVGGLNRGIIVYNDDDNNDDNRISMRTGVTLGAETTIGHLIFGSVYIQRGANYKAGALDYIGSYTFNYISGYIMGKLTYQEVLSGFGGFQFGKGLGGTQEGDVDDNLCNGAFKAKDFNIDFGLTLGADIMYSSAIGLRASYYIGLTDVLSEVPSNDNIKNRGIGIYLIYRI